MNTCWRQTFLPSRTPKLPWCCADEGEANVGEFAKRVLYVHVYIVYIFYILYTLDGFYISSLYDSLLPNIQTRDYPKQSFTIKLGVGLHKAFVCADMKYECIYQSNRWP